MLRISIVAETPSGPVAMDLSELESSCFTSSLVRRRLVSDWVTGKQRRVRDVEASREGVQQISFVLISGS